MEALKRQLQVNIHKSSKGYSNLDYYIEQLEMLNNRLAIFNSNNFFYKILNYKHKKNLLEDINIITKKINILSNDEKL